MDTVKEKLGSFSQRPRVRVSIVTHRTPETQLVSALQCLFRSPSVERVSVIDNSPDARLENILLERKILFKGGVVDYRHVDNRGFGAGHNISIRESLESDVEFHLVMNADVWWDGDVIGALLEFMDRHPYAGMTMPRVRYPDGQLQYACRLLPGPTDLFVKRFLPPSWSRKRMRRYLLADADRNAVFNPPYLLGSFLFFRTSALRRAGLFDERFFMYPEDMDITRRIHRFAPTLFCPEAEIVHEHAAASRKSSRMLRIHMVNMIRYFNKWGWFFDSERRRFNRDLLRQLPRSEYPEPGRG